MIFIDLDQEERRRLRSVLKKMGDDYALLKMDNSLKLTGQEYSTTMSVLRLLSKIEVNEKETTS